MLWTQWNCGRSCMNECFIWALPIKMNNLSGLLCGSRSWKQHANIIVECRKLRGFRYVFARFCFVLFFFTIFILCWPVICIIVIVHNTHPKKFLGTVWDISKSTLLMQTKVHDGADTCPAYFDAKFVDIGWKMTDFIMKNVFWNIAKCEYNFHAIQL